MSNNKQSMKLYTEEQVIEIIKELEKAFLPQNIECDGKCCTGCWKDNVRKTLAMLKNSTSIELPSDEEINDYANDNVESISFKRGAKWMRNKIQGGNNANN